MRYLRRNMINDINKNLQRGVILLKSISNDTYTNSSVAPYFSSIGCHIRHILDVFNCILIGYEEGEIDLTSRERNAFIEENIQEGLTYINEIQNRLSEIQLESLKKNVFVIDNIGSGNKTVETTLEAILLQAHSHTVHHFATIGYIIHQLNIELPDSDFGFNATTPKKAISS